MCIQPPPSVLDFEYDVMAKRLDLRFADGSRRSFQRVPRSVYAAMRRAGSATEFYRSNVLGTFAYTVPMAARRAA